MDHYWKEIPKSKMRKGDQVWYGRSNFGFYVRMQKFLMKLNTSNSVHKTLAPYGAGKGQMLVGLWNPHKDSFSDTNVYIPKSKIRKVMRSYKRRK